MQFLSAIRTGIREPKTSQTGHTVLTGTERALLIMLTGTVRAVLTILTGTERARLIILTGPRENEEKWSQEELPGCSWKSP